MDSLKGNQMGDGWGHEPFLICISRSKSQSLKGNQVGDGFELEITPFPFPEHQPIAFVQFPDYRSSKPIFVIPTPQPLLGCGAERCTKMAPW